MQPMEQENSPANVTDEEKIRKMHEQAFGFARRGKDHPFRRVHGSPIVLARKDE